MYIYIYDSDANKRRLEKTLIKIERKITDLGLGGKIVRLEGIKDKEKIIKNETRGQAKTIVAVGNDQTLNNVVNAVLKENIKTPDNKPPVIAIIPLEEKNNLIAKSFGFKNYEEACEALLARRIESLTLATANKEFFLGQAEILGNYNKINIEKDYSIEIKKVGKISVINLPLEKKLSDLVDFKKKNKILKLLILPKKNSSKSISNQSVFSLKKLTVTEKTKAIVLDNCKKLSAPATIQTTDKSLDFIVGKKRLF